MPSLVNIYIYINYLLDDGVVIIRKIKPYPVGQLSGIIERDG